MNPWTRRNRDDSGGVKYERKGKDLGMLRVFRARRVKGHWCGYWYIKEVG